MIAQHTPGPWEVDLKTATATVRTTQGTSVARCYQGDNDARLIAACPDLLAALQELVADNLTLAENIRNIPALARAEAAISKATQLLNKI